MSGLDWQGMEIALREPKTADELDRYYDLRWRVLRSSWTQDGKNYRDEREPNSLHMTAWIGDQLVGTGRLHLLNGEEVQVRSMAVEQGFERRGIGGLILRELEKRAVERGARRVVLDARDSAVPFYRKLGYQVLEQSYTLFNEIVHWRMWKDL